MSKRITKKMGICMHTTFIHIKKYFFGRNILWSYTYSHIKNPIYCRFQSACGSDIKTNWRPHDIMAMDWFESDVDITEILSFSKVIRRD